MAHAPNFDVVVDEWESGGKRPRSVTATCRACAEEFQAIAAQSASPGAFATYLGAIHLCCARCGATGPVQFRRLKAR